MLHGENHSASLCRLNQKAAPAHPSLSAASIYGDTPECDCAKACMPPCVVSSRVEAEGQKKGGLMKSL